jgi:hypothetical protein
MNIDTSLVGQVYQVPFSALMAGATTLNSSAPAGSYQRGSYQLGSYQIGSYQLGSYQLDSAQFGGSYQLGSYQLGSAQFGGSYQLGSYQLSSAQFGGSYQVCWCSGFVLRAGSLWTDHPSWAAISSEATSLAAIRALFRWPVVPSVRRCFT